MKTKVKSLMVLSLVGLLVACGGGKGGNTGGQGGGGTDRRCGGADASSGDHDGRCGGFAQARQVCGYQGLRRGCD